MSLTKRAPAGLAPLAIALLEGGIALEQLWLFWLAPMEGAVIGALV